MNSKLLIAHGAARDLKDDRGETAADIARKLGREREAKAIEDSGAALPGESGEARPSRVKNARAASPAVSKQA
jgi:hypothetical protein